ncbi:acyclic terpene utilization AtuA family protein [Variovorax sp. KK3]|uniref:acyclic terpene utilization AtuA family protein n=1 Tax=Variovorax sp. KK3 TaxID=1855728 RepID=UPI002118FE7F|nr:acyclic terpene utilization AtuA family protein [Variovorax sp. KK3]
MPTGSLGAGIRSEHLEAGIAAGAHGIACDAGSTDSGPAYLSSGRCKYSKGAIKADLRVLMLAQAKAHIPLLIGSCGTSGCDMALDWTRDIVIELAHEHGLALKIAVLYSEQRADLMATLASGGNVTPLAPLQGTGADLFEQCDHIVALMGPEPYMKALEAGADIVLGGRTTDTAVIAALPLLRGAGKAASWHAGKISECGGLCTTHSREGGVLVRVGKEAFEVEPLGSVSRCTPFTVSAHMLYENSDPFLLTEPGGVLDVTQALYEAVDERIVRVTGSQFHERPYTMKLEGAGRGGFQTIMLVGIQDRAVCTEVEAFIERMHKALCERVVTALELQLSDFDISLRPYGWNAVTGLPVDDGGPPPREIGLMFVATAQTQELATQIAKTCNPWFFHMPIRPEVELPSYGFPFSPSETERGPVYDFKLNHVVHVGDALELVRMEYVSTKEACHA